MLTPGQLLIQRMALNCCYYRLYAELLVALGAIRLVPAPAATNQLADACVDKAHLMLAETSQVSVAVVLVG